MLETIFWCLIGWMIGSFLIRSLLDRDRDVNDHTPITLNKLPRNAIVIMPIHMEQIEGWWYGWFINENGTETFVSQGKTYDEALNNCKKRVQERNPDLRVQYKFEMKNANTTVQS